MSSPPNAKCGTVPQLPGSTHQQQEQAMFAKTAINFKTKQWVLKEEDRFGAHEMIHVYKVDPKTAVN
jgi:hypothetical protein